MDKLIVSHCFCDEVMYGFQWTHPKQLVMRALITHWNSIICLKIEMYEASLLAISFCDFEVFLLPAFADPANALIIHRIIRCMGVAIFDDIDRRYSLDETSTDGYRNVSILFFYGVKVSLEIYEAEVALIVETVYCVIVLQHFSDLASVYLIDFAE